VEVSLRIQDPSGSVVRDVHVRTDGVHHVSEVTDALVAVMEWPRESMHGEPVVYQLRRLGNEAAIHPTVSVDELALVQGETLILGPTR
jgi:hypothetical protein